MKNLILFSAAIALSSMSTAQAASVTFGPGDAHFGFNVVVTNNDDEHTTSPDFTANGLGVRTCDNDGSDCDDDSISKDDTISFTFDDPINLTSISFALDPDDDGDGLEYNHVNMVYTVNGRNNGPGIDLKSNIDLDVTGTTFTFSFDEMPHNYNMQSISTDGCGEETDDCSEETDEHEFDGVYITGITYTSPVPVPAAIWLFGTGLITLVGFARRKV